MYGFSGIFDGNGGSIYFGNLYFFFILIPINKRQIIKFNVVILRVIGVLLFIIIHGVFSLLFNDSFDEMRFLQAYVFLIIFMLGTVSLAFLVEKLTSYQSDCAVRFVFFALLIVAILAIVGYSPFFNTTKAVVFFQEPSHFAINFSPFLFYMVVRSPFKRKLVLLFLGILLAVLLENFTFIICMVIITMFTVRLKIFLYTVLIATIFLIYSPLLDFSYYTERLNFSNEINNTNLSTLVFMQGWERAYLNCVESFGFGVGFQQFGIVGNLGKLMNVVIEIAEIPLNLLDGSTVAIKLIGEFGVFALAIILAYVLYFIKIGKKIYIISLHNTISDDPRMIFFFACFILFSVDLFIRGTGYFSYSTFIFIVSLHWIFTIRSFEIV